MRFSFFNEQKDISTGSCFPNHNESTHNHGSENCLSSQATSDHYSLLWPSTFYQLLFNSLHQRHLSGVFSVHNWTTEYQDQVLPPVWQWTFEMTSQMSLQMDPVQKAVMTHTFGPPMVKTKRPIISCNICQIRFNSEVCLL